MSRATQLNGARKMIDAAARLVRMAAGVLPRDPAFNDIRLVLCDLVINLENRASELHTYASLAATIETAADPSLPAVNADAGAEGGAS